MEKTPVVDKKYRLKKFPGKGGWTYVTLPEIKPEKKTWFGMLKVYGRIDDFAFKNKTLMPLGNGTLFLPVNAEMRKKTGKAVGDAVHMVLYSDQLGGTGERPELGDKGEIKIPEEIRACFDNEPPRAWKKFTALPKAEQRQWLEWVYEPRQEQARADRIAEIMERLV